jgi:hypothetical protein
MEHNPEYLRTPETACNPDRRNELSSVLTEDGLRQKTIDDQHRAIVEITLHKSVPDNVRIQFETVKNLYLYSWFVYRFYPVANLHAYTCLELALRVRFESEMPIPKRKREFGSGLSKLLKHAIDNGHLRNENFEIWRRHTENNARRRTELEAFEKMERLELTEMQFDESSIVITDEDRNHDYLAIILKTIPWLRNHHAHGSESLDKQALGTISLVAEIINQIY